jgi:choline dehydrogenase
MATGYDYIVIGAGSAGAVIAARLSEDKDVRVLLLEAGGRDNHPFQTMPLGFLRVVASDRYNWKFESEPEPGLNNRRLEIPRGKTLGGSSSINALMYIRGNAMDYNLWRQQGCDGWGYEDVLPYFKKLETSWRGENEFHGASGPVRTEPVDFPDMLFDDFRRAAEAAGIPYNNDPNGAVQDGFARMEQNTGDGRRTSTARAYLNPAMSRANLVIETGALSSKIIVENNRAKGVDYIQNGQRKTAYADGEVIVCGGSFNSPHLLMLSGIGPADHLRDMNIPVVHDMPGVGQNLSEHANMLSVQGVRDDLGLTRQLRVDRATGGVLQWLFKQGGAFSTNGAVCHSFLRTRDNLVRPDVQIVHMTLSNRGSLWVPGMTKKPQWCFSARVGGPLSPLSRGWVKLRSADPAAKPRIQYNMFTEREDMDTMIRALRMSREIYAQSPIADYITHEIEPGSAVQSDADLEANIRANATHRSHPCGTCKMGIDDLAVVDPQLRVHGLEGLRIADASIMPEVIAGNTNTPCMMIGEKAADLVRGKLAAQVAGA